MTTAVESVWFPQAGVTRHSSTPLPADLVFFAPPPPEIGRVVTADSTLTSSKQPRSSGQRMFFAALAGVAVALILALLFQSSGLAILLGAIVAGAVYFFTRFSHRCSYVGEQGIASFSIDAPIARPKANILSFRDADNLFTRQTRHYTNGVYTGTSYEYRWTKSSGNAHRLNGLYRGEKRSPKEDDAWHFADSAETAWSLYRLQTINEQLDQFGYVEFAMQGNPKAVRIGSGFLEFVFKDNTTQRAAVADLSNIRLGSGTFRFNHKDARWWSGQGKYSFSYAALPNARLFLICLKQLTGIHWE